MDNRINSTSTVQDATTVKPTMVGRVTDFVTYAGTRVGTVVVVGGLLAAGGAYWLYRKLNSTSPDESGDAMRVSDGPVNGVDNRQ